MTHPACQHRLASVLAALFVWSFCVAPSSRAQELLPPSREVVYSHAFPGNWVMPKWHNGFLVEWKFDTKYSDEKTENVVVHDKDGKLFGKARIWVDGATFLRITDADVSADGKVVVVGNTISGSGELSSYLAVISLPATTAHIVQTSPFDGRAVTFAPDGTVWVLGLQGGPKFNVAKAPDHHVIEQFGTDYVLKGQYLLRSEFPCEIHPALTGNLGFPQILASADRIGFFAPNCRTWTELSPEGKLLGTWKWSAGALTSKGYDSTPIRVITFTSTNELYARRDFYSPTDVPYAARLVRFDRNSSTWIPVGTTAAGDAGLPFLTLMNADGDSLVYLAPGKTLVWAKAQTAP